MANHTGGCTCGQVRYQLNRPVLFVHCCHCTWCQRETGSAYALNALIETHEIALTAGQPRLVKTPSSSGAGQLIARCPVCQVALWSHYSGAGPSFAFVRVGTLDQPGLLPPDIHIFTSSKRDFVQLNGDIPAVPEYYDRENYWPADSLARRSACLARTTSEPETGSPQPIHQAAHVLAVPDLVRSTDYYTRVFGFKDLKVNAPGWCFMQRGTCRLQLGQCPDAIPATDTGDHAYFAYWYVDDAEALYAHARSEGAEFIKPLVDEPWGMREFAVRTPDGHRIMIGEAQD